jgi:hypothetical protein
MAEEVGMERAKVALLGLIALGLWLGLVRDGMPEARAEGPSAPIQCNAWYADIPNTMGVDKAVEKAKAHAAPIAEWMTQHPGDPVFRTTMVRTAPMNNIPIGYVDVLCVR